MHHALSLKFLGGAGTVTGSKTVLSFNRQHIMIDCGLFQGIKALRKKNWQQIPLAEEISDVVLTHAHLDHCGLLPRLVKQGFKGAIHCTPITASLARIILLDSAKIQEEDAADANRHRYSRHREALPLYDTEDVHRCLKLFQTHDFDEWVILGVDLKFSFKANGHIPGSALVEVRAGKKTLVFSGDLGRMKPLIMSRPKPLPACDLLVMESTYGDRLHSILSPFDQLEECVNKALAQKGQVLIPSFAVERSQEVIYLLLSLMQQKRIPRVKVFLDSPMAAAVTAVLTDYYRFLKDPALLGILKEVFEVVSDYRASQSVVSMREPKIVIAGSGMMTGGRILHHLEAHVGKPETMVILPGFQAVGTRGHTLAHGGDELKFFGRYHKVRAEVVSLHGLSAHADREEMVQWIRKADGPPGRIVLNHGEPSAADSLRVKLEHAFSIPVSIAVQDMELVLDYEE